MLSYKSLTVSLFLAVLSLLAHRCSAGARECKSQGEIITVDKNNFYSLVHPRKDDWLLYFHAPWCAKCKELGPMLQSVAEQGAGKFYVGSVDCGEDEWIRTLFGLRGYPHFKLCSKERMYPYPTTGVVDEEHLMEFATETFEQQSRWSESFPGF